MLLFFFLEGVHRHLLDTLTGFFGAESVHNGGEQISLVQIFLILPKLGGKDGRELWEAKEAVTDVYLFMKGIIMNFLIEQILEGISLVDR